MKNLMVMLIATVSLFSGSRTYFDTGVFNPWNFLIWSNPDNSEVLNMPLLNSYLESLFSSFETNGYDGIYLSFSQIADIDYLDDPASWSSSLVSPADVFIRNMLLQIYQNCPEGSIEQFLGAFIGTAHRHGVKVFLSFGGEAADGLKICPNKGDTPSTQAQKLSSYLKTYQFDGADFDLESNAIQQSNTTEEINEFFSTLKGLLNANHQLSFLTVMGDISWATIAGSPSKNFDGINLMLYGSGGPGGQYYIDAVNVTWGISEWMDIIGKDYAGMLSIGYQDDTYYEIPSASAGKIYTVDPNNRGISASMIYQQMTEDLAKALYPTNLGECFWWPSISVKGAKGTDRYSVGSDGSADFLSTPMIDFAGAQ